MKKTWVRSDGSPVPGIVPDGDSVNMRILVFILLFLSIDLVFGLSEGETKAIEDFVTEWPYLQDLFPPWTSNASKACEDPPFNGIECSEGPDKHIVGLYAKFYDKNLKNMNC